MTVWFCPSNYDKHWYICHILQKSTNNTCLTPMIEMNLFKLHEMKFYTLDFQSLNDIRRSFKHLVIVILTQWILIFHFIPMACPIYKQPFTLFFIWIYLRLKSFGKVSILLKPDFVNFWTIWFNVTYIQICAHLTFTFLWEEKCFGFIEKNNLKHI